MTTKSRVNCKRYGQLPLSWMIGFLLAAFSYPLVPLSTGWNQYVNVPVILLSLNPGGGGTLGIYWWGCAAGTLEPLTYTRASSAEFCYPILE